MNNIRVLGKFLDQPILVAKFQKAVPALLTAGAAAYTAYDVSKAPDNKKKKRALKTGITMGVTVASALAAPHIASAITKRPLPDTLNVIKQNNAELVDTFMKSAKLDEKTGEILKKSKEKILNLKEVNHLFENIKEKANGKEFLEKLIPSPQNISAKDIFSEIGYLSIYGAVPVAGGIMGGIAADRVVDKDKWKEKIPNKIKEGSYQYLANIFMCNVGAGAALGIMEKLGITSKGARAAGMTAGIVATGIIGGSKIANFIGRNVIDPLFNKSHNHDKNHNNHHKHHHKHHQAPILTDNDILKLEFSDKITDSHLMYKCTKPVKKEKERTPEILDIGLHTDDIATVSLLSGLKWIEPALPMMYTLSGYRAGIGYRN